MKRSLMAMLLVVTMLIGCVSSVSAATAATMTHTEFLNLCKGLATEIEVPVDIAGKDGVKSDKATAYGDLIETYVDGKAAFWAEIDMANVKGVVKSVLDEAELILSADEYAKFKDLYVTGEFKITATWTDLEAPEITDEDIVDGFKGIDGFFEVVSVNVVGNTLEATIKVIDDTKVTKLAELPESISLCIGGFKVLGDADITDANDGKMEATIEGTTQILNPLSTSYDVDYKFVQKDSNPKTEDITPVIVDVNKKKPSGGSAGTTTFFTLKYETNGGTTYSDESHKAGKNVELTKVPEKEGYAFDGWFADAELTNKITSIVMDSDKTVYAAWTAEGEPGGDIAHPVPEILNGDDHIAYIQGYLDGTVRPEASITRAEVAAIFFRLLKEEARAANLTSENSFADVNDGEWFNTPVSTMAKLGIVKGKTEDTFAPNDEITRAEFATICARFDDSDLKCEECNFSDISEHWAEDYILETVVYKWIQGYEDNTFKPDAFITRAEAATIINRVLVRLPEDADALLEGMKVWPDNDASEWYFVAIQEATNSHTYGRVNAVNEKWNELVENRDWSVYED